VYLAPDDRHLALVDRDTLVTAMTEAVGGFRPSATVLFESVAKVYRAAAIGVILTGMGDDGLVGLRALHATGAQIIAQDEASSVVFGMPGAALASGIVQSVVPIHMLASQLKRMIAGAAPATTRRS